MFFAIPFFKNTEFLEKTLQSLISQTDLAWSAIVLDDSIDPGEAKGARTIVSEFRDQRITYQRNETNLGMAKNWNQGLDLGQMIELAVILHADDRLKPQYVSEMKRLAQRHPDAAGYFCRTEIIDENDQPVFSMADFYKTFLVPKGNEIILSGFDGIQKLIPGNFMFCPSICYRMNKVGQERFRTDLKMVNDFEFILRLLFKKGTWVGFYEKPLFQYRRHTRNTTLILTQNLSRFHEEIALYNSTAAKLNELGEIQLAKLAGKKQVIKLNLLFQIVKSLLGLKFKNLCKETELFMDLFP